MNRSLLRKLENFIEAVRSEVLVLSLFAQRDLNDLSQLIREVEKYFNKQRSGGNDPTDSVA